MAGSVDLSPGVVFAEKFRIVRPLGRGGMGAVYVVTQLSTSHERALKLMHATLVSDERALERFEREARAGQRIDSDHVVEVIDAGIDRATGIPWLCMELLAGESVAERMERAGPPPRPELRRIAEQLGHALGAAHRAGLVHRDLKPENLFLAAARTPGVPFTVKVLDFGIATLVREQQASSATTQGVGSPMWMAPEQTQEGQVTAAADVWSLGLLFFHLLTGRLYWRAPNTGASMTALLVEIMVEPLSPPSERAREMGCAERLPAGFDAWFARCVAREVGERLPDANAALGALAPLLAEHAAGRAQAVAQTRAASAAVPATAVSAAPKPVEPGTMSGKKLVPLLLSIVALMGGVVGVLVLGFDIGRRGVEPPPSPMLVVHGVPTDAGAAAVPVAVTPVLDAGPAAAAAVAVVAAVEPAAPVERPRRRRGGEPAAATLMQVEPGPEPTPVATMEPEAPEPEPDPDPEPDPEPAPTMRASGPTTEWGRTTAARFRGQVLDFCWRNNTVSERLGSARVTISIRFRPGGGVDGLLIRGVDDRQFRFCVVTHGTERISYRDADVGELVFHHSLGEP